MKSSPTISWVKILQALRQEEIDLRPSTAPAAREVGVDNMWDFKGIKCWEPEIVGMEQLLTHFMFGSEATAATPKYYHGLSHGHLFGGLEDVLLELVDFWSILKLIP